jgi:hypothetical protein
MISYSQGIVKNRRRNLKTYLDCFLGSEAVEWLLKEVPNWDKSDVIRFCVYLAQNEIIRAYENSENFFMFDWLYYLPTAPKYCKAPITRSIAEILHNHTIEEVCSMAEHPQTGFVRDKGLKGKYFVGNEAVGWFVETLNLKNRGEGIVWARSLQKRGCFARSKTSLYHTFTDTNLVYQWFGITDYFTNDEAILTEIDIQGNNNEIDNVDNSKSSSITVNKENVGSELYMSRSGSVDNPQLNIEEFNIETIQEIHLIPESFSSSWHDIPKSTEFYKNSTLPVLSTIPCQIGKPGGGLITCRFIGDGFNCFI